MPSKRDITEKLIGMLPAVSLDSALSSWWTNLRSNGGLRLTPQGYDAFTKLEIESWRVTVDDIKRYQSKKILLDLDRKVNYPYYIDYKNKTIIFFSSKEAMTVTLFGNLENWLNVCENRNK
jgi:hypothetical protein